jgi:hypothetical protein
MFHAHKMAQNWQKSNLAAELRRWSMSTGFISFFLHVLRLRMANVEPKNMAWLASESLQRISLNTAIGTHGHGVFHACRTFGLLSVGVALRAFAAGEVA